MLFWATNIEMHPKVKNQNSKKSENGNLRLERLDRDVQGRAWAILNATYVAKIQGSRFSAPQLKINIFELPNFFAIRFPIL